MLSLLLSLFLYISFVNAGIYVTEPAQGQVCHGGQPCTITWLDDGSAPLLNTVGACTLGLYTGNQQLVQQIEPVDVATTRSTTFTPNPAAGPNSSRYYIALISTSLQVNGSPYIGYSPPFTLDQMSGSFSSPLPSATSPIPVPSSVSSAPSNTILSTITVGTLSTTVSVSAPSSESSRSAAPSSATPSSASPSVVPQPSSTVTLPPSAAPSPSAASSGFLTSLSPSGAPSTSPIPSASPSASAARPRAAISASAPAVAAVALLLAALSL